MKHTKPRDKSPVTWLVVTVLLLSAIGAALWVPLYARSGPKLGAFPFFYWYQLVLVPVVAVASWVCYLLLRPARSAQSPGPPGSSGDSSPAPREEAR
jgi:membrane protein implicated in regulation of membrane protease activity